MLKSISNFGNNAAALEKTLRLAQALAQIGAGLSATPKESAPWLLARSQFNLSRRFFRLHKWIDCLSVAQTHFYAESDDSVLRSLEVIKWGFLGIYFFLEMSTITNVMGMTSTTWGPSAIRESNKFWFYALFTSILLSLYEFWAIGFQSPTTDVGVPEEAQDTKEESPEIKVDKSSLTHQSLADKEGKRKQIYKQLVMDGCDLIIPGAAVGWVSADPVTVGVAQSISTILAMRDMWIKIQSDASNKP